MEDSIVERVIVLMEHYGLSASAFADKIDVQRSSMSHLVSGRNKPSLDFIQKVLNNFSDINPTWLIMGTGPMTQLDLFDIKGDVAPIQPIPEEKFRAAPSTASAVAEQTSIKQSFQEIEPPVHEPVRVVYAQSTPTPVSESITAPQSQVVYREEPVIAPPPVVIQAPVVPNSPPQVIQEQPAPVIQPPVPVQPPVVTQAAEIPVTQASPVVQQAVQPEKSRQNDKKVVKIVFFYSDNTFESFNPH